MDLNRDRLPLLSNMEAGEEVFWINEYVGEPEDTALFNRRHMLDAEARLLRFAPFIKRMFPQTEASGGIIESPLKEIKGMKASLEREYGFEIPGRLFLKCDSHLPVSGSIKARGGIYEVLKLAETIAVENGMLSLEDDYSALAEESFRQLFSSYSVAVGSTGNLGLSIGIISAALGFRVTVHMSADAREWKKALLRTKGVTVVEYPQDYQVAVAKGREEALLDPFCHFVDDEGSRDLFLGYSVAALRIIEQFECAGISVDEEHPAIFYLPCGVGGAPGGVAFGLKEIFGKNAYCFFAEPTQAPCMLLGMMTGLHNGISVADIGLCGKTAADGLAVGRPSSLVGRVMEKRLAGCFTATDAHLYKLLSMLKDAEDIFVEPSACAGFPGIYRVFSQGGEEWKRIYAKATHIVWATGGSMVPPGEMEQDYEKGKERIKIEGKNDGRTRKEG